METKTPQETNQKLDDQKSKQGKSAAPSPLSSPSHEFSFTITLHPSPNNTPSTFKPNRNSSSNNKSNKNTSSSCSPSSSLALDLAPADDIFFHGHLLPLHFLSHPPISPRPSTDSIYLINEDLTLPSLPHTINPTTSTSESKETKKKPNSLLSSFLGLNKLWLKIGSDEDDDTRKKKNKKKGFDLKHFLKKYASMLEPLFSPSSKSRQKDKRDDLRQRPYSFSGHSNTKEMKKWTRRRAEFSAPASMRTSPTNSGLLISTPTAAAHSSSNEISSMEELQSAIQAAIAHCKNSTAITKEDKKSIDI